MGTRPATGFYPRGIGLGRLTPAGAPDTNFGGDGYVEDLTDEVSSVSTIHIRGDGRIWFSGSASVGSSPYPRRLRPGPGQGRRHVRPHIRRQRAGSQGRLVGQTVNSDRIGESVLDGDTLVAVGRAANTIHGGWLDEDGAFALGDTA